MKYMHLSEQDDSNPRTCPFLNFSAKRAEQGLNIVPLNIRRRRMREDRG